MIVGAGILVAASLFMYLILAPAVPRLLLAWTGIVVATLFLYLILAMAVPRLMLAGRGRG